MASEEDVLELLQQQIDVLKGSRQQQLQLNAEKAAGETALRDAAIKCAQGLVRLDVGGVQYTTSLTTLTAAPDSFFASLFSGDWQSAKTAEGNVFVDRDGEVFKHILQYLRSVRDQQPFACAGSLTRDELAAIATEAQFYGLADLERATTELSCRQEYEYKYLITHSAMPYNDPVGVYDLYERGKGSKDLLHLHGEGWQYVASHVVNKVSVMFVLRRQL